MPGVARLAVICACCYWPVLGTTCTCSTWQSDAELLDRDRAHAKRLRSGKMQSMGAKAPPKRSIKLILTLTVRVLLHGFRD